MVEGTKVRLVRCPKCANLLPELADYPLYECGGCGATLQSKRYAASLKQKFKEEEKEFQGLPTEQPSLDERSSCSASQISDQKPNVDGVVSSKEIDGVVAHDTGRKKEDGEMPCVNADPTSLPEVVNPIVVGNNPEEKGSAPETFHPETVERNDGPRLGGEFDGKTVSNETKTIVEDNEMFQTGNRSDTHLKNSLRNARNCGVDDGVRLGNSSGERKGKGLRWGSGYRVGIPPREDELNLRNRSLLGNGAMYRAYPDEGPSHYRHTDPRNYDDRFFHQGMDSVDRVEHLEQDRRELLRKLDELREQITKSCEISDIPVADGISSNARRVQRLPPHHGSYGPMRNLREHSQHDDVMRRPYYYVRDLPDVDARQACAQPLLSRQQAPGPLLNHARHTHDEVLMYKDPYGDPLMRVPTHQNPQIPNMSTAGRCLMNRNQNSYFAGRYAETDPPDSVIPVAHEHFYRHPSCSCSSCYYRQFRVPAHIRSEPHCNWRIPRPISGSTYYHDANDLSPMGEVHDYMGYVHPPRYQSCDIVQRIENTDLDHTSQKEKHNVVKNQPEVGKSSGFSPVGGGAPFVSCCYCFKLLKLPKKLGLAGDGPSKLICGACSKTILVSFDGKNLTSSAYAPEDYGSVSFKSREEGFCHAECASSGQRNPLDNHPNPKQKAIFHVDCSNALPSYLSNLNASSDFISSIGQMEERPNLSEHEKGHSDFSSSSASQDEEGPDSTAANRKIFNKLSFKSGVDSPAVASPHHEDSGNSSFDETVSKFGGHRYKLSGEQKVYSSQGLPNKKSLKDLKQNSFKEASIATEMDLSLPKDSTLYMMQDSMDRQKEEPSERGTKGTDSFLANFIKKSFRDFSRVAHSSDNERIHVSINGISIPDRFVRKAEKQAGPIHPGNYWYDRRAGFWGVMGQPCLGIIPPFIEEFNHPMMKDCSGGDTGVLVNGRELHHKDLDLLASRGLPTTRDKSYIIDISGSVYDEVTGAEMDSLGKLAPTIEKVKHGFGMRVPKVP